MIAVSEVAKRYASALFESIANVSSASSYLEELRQIEKALFGDAELKKFVETPLVTGAEKTAAVRAAFEKTKVSEEIKNLLYVLSENDRLSEWKNIVTAFEKRTDEAHGMVRGVVRSAAALGPEQRQKIEAKVSQLTGKKAILEYKEEPELLGGLVAEVGSLTFDDSLETQLRLMNEELKRSAH